MLCLTLSKFSNHQFIKIKFHTSGAQSPNATELVGKNSPNMVRAVLVPVLHRSVPPRGSSSPSPTAPPSPNSK